ncbi:MBL fold metallo-hydrolase [Corynebacterium sanguinis]|uniref:MBL fold metallo-hydrolase n=1 Tax=Corynebacterium sanguinis TaxID=2594913 RepID=UPI0011A2D443|nr:MBL fold metallo-hydrolase [Corynebacterium sanguinis]MCT1585529.1 MBL fold metallo-hydrolase [Corynebacterium sanguinis]MCT1598304.1 MBL fold metallo-hydrolase [Corynebacterium sanguinis]MCT2024125.1 MBL fold metallo-hydrolase [Corynebacterium sanguinis]MCT2047782.1 MBL fold metallo-hydrolase [Corynebacterium sanguinis]
MSTTFTLHQISVSDMDNNVYLIASEGKGLLIDAAADAPAIFRLAEEAGVEITDVLTTHRHEDHTRALPEVLERTGARHWASFLDAPALPAPVDVELGDDDAIEFVGQRLNTMILRGHTPGGAAVVVDIDGTPNAFVGDSLFPGGLGKTAGEGEFVRLFKEVTTKLFDVYPDATIVRPGHGEPTTLGKERASLDEWWRRRW